MATTAIGTERKRGGPKTPFGPKSLPNRSHSLTDLGKRLAAAAAERYGTSESNIVEYALRTVRWTGTEASVFTDAMTT